MATPKYLLRALKDAPEAVRSAIVAGEKSMHTTGATGSFVADLATSVVPPAKKGLSYLTGAAARKAHHADVAAGEILKKVPAVGKLTRTTESIPFEKLPGDVALKAEVPVHKATEPARKATRLAVPLLALVGYERLTNPPKETTKMAHCGHEELLKEAAGMIRQLQREKEELVTKVARLQVKAEAEQTVDQMVREGWLPEEERTTKVAEILRGDVRLATVKEAMKLRGAIQMPRLGELEDPEETTRVAGSEGAEKNETLEYIRSLGPY